MKNDERINLKISKEIYEKMMFSIKDLNDFTEKYGVPAGNKKEQIERGEEEIPLKFKRKKIPELTVKAFTEAALLHYIKNKYDPRYYDDSKDVVAAVNRLRNSIFSFQQVQERNLIVPILNILKNMDEYIPFNEKMIYSAIKAIEIYFLKSFEPNTTTGLSELKKNNESQIDYFNRLQDKTVLAKAK